MKANLGESQKYEAGQIVVVKPSQKALLENLLTGRFSNEFVAKTLPQMQSEFPAEQPHFFEILQRPHTSFFSPLVIGLKTLKRQDFILVFFPLLLILMKNMSIGELPQFSSFFLTFLGLHFLVFSLRLRNQFVDHVRGFDRWNPEKSFSPLMEGTVRAFEINQWSVVFFTLTMVCLLPLVFIQLELLILAIPALILAIYSQYFQVSAFKEKTYGEVLIFILFGPLFVSGLELTLFRRVQASTLFDGFVIGIATMFLLNLKVFGNFLFLSKAKSQNTLVKLGFDRAKNYLMFLGFFLCFIQFVGQFFFLASPEKYFFSLALILVPLFYGRFFLRCQSSAGSDVLRLRDRGTEGVYVIYLFWIGIYLWLITARGMILL